MRIYNNLKILREIILPLTRFIQQLAEYTKIPAIWFWLKKFASQFQKPNPVSNQSALTLQKAWRQFKQRHELDISDLIWLREQGIGLRNQSRELGLKERVDGGYGDSYSLAVFFVPSEVLISQTDPHEIEFRKRLNCWGHSKELFPTERIDKITMGENAYRLFQDAGQTHGVHQSVIHAILRQMKAKIIKIIQQSLRMEKKNDDFNVFHLTRRGKDAQIPQDYEEYIDTYPTGKCGVHPFNKDEILATVEEGVYFRTKAPINPVLSIPVSEEVRRIPSSERKAVSGMPLMSFTQYKKRLDEDQQNRDVKRLGEHEAIKIYSDLVKKIKILKRC